MKKSHGYILVCAIALIAAGSVAYYLLRKKNETIASEKTEGAAEANSSPSDAQINKLVAQDLKTNFSAKNQAYIDSLNPAVKQQFINFIQDIQKLGYTVIITDGYRTFQQSAKFKKQDARNATPGFSSHNYGTALDLVLVKDKHIIQKNAPTAEWVSTGVPALAKSKYGMRWGGDFPGYPDNVHFDFNNKYNTKDLYAAAMKKFGSVENAKGNELQLV